MSELRVIYHIHIYIYIFNIQFLLWNQHLHSEELTYYSHTKKWHSSNKKTNLLDNLGDTCLLFQGNGSYPWDPNTMRFGGDWTTPSLWQYDWMPTPGTHKWEVWEIDFPFWIGWFLGSSRSFSRVLGLHGRFHKIGVFPPKPSILIGCSIINHPFWGTPIFGNTLIASYTPHFHPIRSAPSVPWNRAPLPAIARRARARSRSQRLEVVPGSTGSKRRHWIPQDPMARHKKKLDSRNFSKITHQPFLLSLMSPETSCFQKVA